MGGGGGVGQATSYNSIQSFVFFRLIDNDTFGKFEILLDFKNEDVFPKRTVHCTVYGAHTHRCITQTLIFQWILKCEEENSTERLAVKRIDKLLITVAVDCV